MSLGLVIPVWNDQKALNRLLDQVRQMSLFDEIVVVDDGSDIPVEVDAAHGLPVQVIRHVHARGPGVARNAGLAELTSEHVLFFDSDDLLTEELPRLWKELQGETFDFCIFRHCDSRQSRQGRWRQMPYDDAFWRQAGMGGRALRDLPEAARPILARTANYPWNKIFRTDFLRVQRIACAEMLVHEDIEPHWAAFLRAERILASDRIAAVHHVAHGANRLTDRRGKERLEVFSTLAQLFSEVEAVAPERHAFVPAFLWFTADLLDWIRGNIEPRWHAELARQTGEFLRRALRPDLAGRLSREDPVLALRLTLQMAEGRWSC